MTLVLTDEQTVLSSTVRQFLEAKSSEAELRRLIDTDEGFDRGVWRQLAELGVVGFAIDEAYGGVGASFIELGLVVEQAGRSLYSGPLLSTAVLAASALALSGDDAAQSEFLPKIAAGECVAALAVNAVDGSVDLSSLAVTSAEGAWTLDGVAPFVIDGAEADLLIVVAAASDGIGVFAVAADAPGVTRTPLVTLDLTRRQARIEFTAAVVRRIGDAGSAERSIPVVLRRASVALAMEQIGGMQKTLETAVAYAQTRVQFGRAIGSFQAVKHKCADMLVKVELAKSAAYYALWATVHAPDEVAAAASLAQAYCSDAYVDITRANIMVHGGIGFTWEHSAHLYYRRAKSDHTLFGTPAEHRELVLQSVVGI